MPVEVTLQFGGAVVLLDDGFALAVDVEVDQGHPQRFEPAGLAQHGAVDPGLGPVQGTALGGQPVEIAAEGLDLFEPAEAGVVAVGPAAYMQGAVIGRQCDFGFVVLAAAAGDPLVAFDAFLCAGAEAQALVQVAFARSERAQGADSNGVGGHGRRRRMGRRNGPRWREAEGEGHQPIITV